MKKGLLFGIFMIMSVVLLAQESTSANDAGSAVAQHETHVTPAQALNVGYTFMRTGDGSKGNGTKSSNVSKQAMQLIYTGQAYDSLTGTVTDCYYVFALQPKGFVIVAADDRVEPILGYSYDNDFVVANMPDHVRAWLGSYERQIEAVTKSNLQPTLATESKWANLRSGQSTGTRSSGTVGPLLTTTWDQTQYYNSLCPADASGLAGHVPTGCVATAMAQIIHYWGYPVHGRGTHSYESNYGTLTVNYANANYDYTLMPDALTSTSITQEVNAVAGLIRDCGVAVNMGYSPSESSSFDQDARAALINFYRFSPNLSFAEKAYFSESEWNAMLHADLDNNRPVYYSGKGSDGHAFVCDGYNADGYYHFNFGWGGFADGWFLTSSITPGGSNFNDDQAALFGIVPDSTGNVILGQTKGTSTFTVDEPLEFYHLMGNNAYEGGFYDNSCNNTIHFIPADSTNQIVADILDYEDQTLTFSDGNGNTLRSLVGGNDNDYSPVVSSQNALNIAYSGNMYYAGFQLSISQTNPNECRMVSNITSFIESTTVHLTWTENGNATQWEVEYGVKGFALGTGTTYTTTTNTVTFSNLQPLTEYDFYIRSVCGSNYYGQWSKVSLIIQGPYWQDIVTSQPAGYTYNTTTNSVEISTAEQLAWWAKTGNGIDGHLAADIDLSGYRWQPTKLSNRNFNGHGHVITNLYVIQGNGFFSECAEGCIIENVGLTNAYINNSEAGGLCGSLWGTMRNCYVTNSLIQAKNDANLAESFAGGLVCINSGSIINCYVNADVTSYNQGGLLACYSYGTIRNCYSTGTLPRLSWCYYGSIAAVVSGEISHCYSNDACSAGFTAHSMGITTITDVSYFESASNGWPLLTPIVFDEVTENDLLSALNRGVEMYNDSAYCTWMADTGNRNGGFPVFGNRYVNLCPNVTDISIQNVIVDNQHAVTIGWTENGDVSQLLIRYKDHLQPDTAYSYVMATRNPDTLFGIPLGHEYDFNVRTICDTVHRSSWGKTWKEIIDLPYWTDIVTTKPDGYVEDADGNVEIYSTEGLAWISIITNGLQNQPQNPLTGKTVTLKSDINLEGYRWYPIEDFAGIFDGENHRISNIYMNSEIGGLFGIVGDWNRVVVVKNVILEGGSITCGIIEDPICPYGYGGGLIGLAHFNCEISNCHVSTTIHSRYSVPTGALCGQTQTGGSGTTIPTILVSNCSASSTVYGGSQCGNLIGNVLGNVHIRNCYATGNVYPASEISGNVYCRGVMIGAFEGETVNNCLSTGMAYNCLPSEMNISNSGCYGKVIGCPSNTNIHHLYGQNNVNAGLAEYGLDEVADNSLFTHSGNTNILLNPVSIKGTNYSDLLDALNAWVVLQNDTDLRTWVLDTLTGHPVFGDFYVPSCYTPTDLTVSQATTVDDPTIKTRLAWTQKGEPDHWEVLFVASDESIESGTSIIVNNNSFVMAGIPVGEPLDFYVRAVCGDADTSAWCSPVSYIPDKLRWTEVVTSQPEGYQKKSDGKVYISSAEGLAWVASVVNRLNGNNSYDGVGDIILTEDIDLSAYRWTAIGNQEHRCYHSFNGNNHVISGLYCNELSNFQGLFGILAGETQNLTLTQCDVRGIAFNGSIAGSGWGNMRNCIVNGSVSGLYSGGLIGYYWNGPIIENSCFVSKDNKHGNPVVNIGGSENANCYVGISDTSTVTNRYYNSSTYYDDFSGDDYTWTINSPLYINGAFQSDLVDALNSWVDANNTIGPYRRWVADTAMVNGGYPIFESVSYPAVSAHDTVMAAGYYNWHGMVFTSDTVVYDTITTLIGYDSVVTHHIIVIPALLTEITVDTCSSYIWNSETYSKTGNYVQTFPSAGGGDSVVVLHLSINPPTGEDEHFVCDNSFTWIDGVTYFASNHSSTYTLQTTDGCDSVVTLHLTVGHSNTEDTTAVACNSFNWHEYANLTQSGDYTRTLTNASGCDSVVTLHLTINQSSTGIDELTACDSLIWIDGITYTESNNTATYTLTNAAGCDSLVTLQLTVNYSSTGDTTAVSCDSFDWYELVNLTQSGDYMHTFTNASGCDSVVTLHLTVNHSSFTDTTAVEHFSFDWYEYTNLTQSGDYTRTFTNANGCDSVITLHLTVITPPAITTSQVSDVTAYSAICGGNVIADGCAEVTERGICWSTSQNPTVADSHTSDSSGVGTFSSQLIGLEPNTTYYMRAYATNSVGTAYGEELMFTTASQFTCGENLVVNYYSYTTMNYGSQCWMTQNLRNASGSEQFDYPDVLQACPTGWHLPDNNDWNTLGIYLPSSSVYFGNGDYWTSTLIPYQTYQGEQFTLISPPYVNSNSVSFSSGTACEVHDAAQGNCQVHTELSVRCLRNENAYASLPTVTTQAVSNIMPNTAICGGIITSDGGATVTERGVCWSVSENPTIADSHTINGGGAGAFTSQLTGLELNITYHVRAYATNSAGTAYGEEVTFTTDLCGTINISISGEDGISYICESEPVTLTANVEADGFTPENLHYIWYEDGQVRDNMTFGLGDTNVYAEYWAARSSIYTFSVVVTYGAHLSCVAQSEERYVRVYPQPAKPVVTVDQTSIYDGGQVVLSVINSDLNTFSYTWYKNGVVIPGATGTNLVDNPTTVDGETTHYVYTVEASNLYTGCTSEPSEPTVVTVNATPTATVTAEGSTMLCEGETVTLHVDVTPANDSYSYQWYVDGSLISGATSADYVVSEPASDMAYNFAVAVYANGGLDILVPGPAITVMPAPFVTALASEISICEGGTSTLTAWVAGSSANYGYNFQWFRSIPHPDGTSDTNLVGTNATYTTSSNVPVNSYTYWVEVTSEYGCSSQSNPLTLTVKPNPSVTISGNTTFCEGGYTTLYANVTPDQEASYVWYKDGAEMFFSMPSIPATDGGVYTVAATVYGCSSQSDPITLTVKPNPSVFISGGTTFCEGGSTTLYANVTPDQDATYVWYKNGAEMALYTPSITVTDGGTYTVEATANGCSDLARYVTVTVEENPQLQLSATETNICIGGHTTITANAVNWSDGNIFYSWSDSYGSGSSYDFSFEQAGLHTITVTATNTASGCQGTNSITINVNDLPETPVVTVNQATVFDGGQVTLSVTNPIPNAIYTWYKNGELIPYTNQSSHTEYLMTNDGEPATYTYSVMAALYNSGCFSESSDNTEVTVFPTPVANVTVNGLTIFCEGSSTTLHVDVTPLNGPTYAYQWYKDGVLIPGATSADYVVAEPARTTSYNFHVVVSANGSYNVTAYAPAVTVVSSPTVVATISENTVCVGGTATLTAMISGGIGGLNGLNNYSYQWFRNADSTTELVGTNYTYTTAGDEPAGTYAYWLAISNGYGCNSQSESVMFTVVDDPTVTITPAAGYNETVCNGGSTVLQANATGGFGEFSYQWYKNGFLLIGETNQTLAINDLYYGVNYTYTVSVTQSGASCATISAPQAVIVNALSYTTLFETACEDYTWNGVTYAQTGEYTQTFTGANGCDSVVTLYLIVNHANTGDTTAVANDLFDWYEHTYLTMSGDYTHVFTNQNGCDSVVTLHLTINNPTISVQDTVMTAGYFIWHGMVFTSDTVLFETIPVLGGYDSLVIYHVFVTPTPLTVLTVNACDSYTLNSQTYAESGDYVQTFPISSGIDSVVVLYLTIFPTDSADFTETACESFTWEGTTYTTSGDYTKTFTNANGCDSVVTLHLTLFPADSTDFAETACEVFTWDGTTYTTSGDYTKTFSNVNGCDSTVTLHLTIFPADSADFAETACESFTWNGTTYTSSGDYTQTFTNANGCDSTVTLHLTVNFPDNSEYSETACDSYTWEGTTYTQSGDYTQTFTNANGCDSIVTLHLTVNHGTHYVESETACESFTWHGTEYTASGTYTYEYTNASGCASVDTLHLTINFAQSAEFAVTTADSCYIWNAETYCESGDYTQTLTAANGCDSTVTLHLTITVGIDDHNDFALNLYPNPTNGMVNVQCTMNNVQVGTMEFHVFDAYGKLVDVVETRCTTSLQTAQIDLSGFANGVFFVKAVADGNVVAVRKMVKR